MCGEWSGSALSTGWSASPSSQPSLSSVLLLAITSTLVSIVDGCLRRSIQKDIATERPFEPRTTLSPSHKQQCTRQEVDEVQCLHEGSCFAVPVRGGRTIGCSCTSEWEGDRCQLRYIDPDLLAVRDQHMRTANIAAGVSVCILVVFVVLLAVYVYLRYRRKGRLLKDHDFEATAEELYRRPFSGRSSIVESISRANSVRKGAYCYFGRGRQRTRTFSWKEPVNEAGINGRGTGDHGDDKLPLDGATDTSNSRYVNEEKLHPDCGSSGSGHTGSNVDDLKPPLSEKARDASL